MALLASILLLPAAGAIHMSPTSWDCYTTTYKYCPYQWDESLKLFVESGGADGAFLSPNDEAAGTATHHQLSADMTSGLSSSIASFQAGRPTQSFEIKLKNPLAADYYLNLTRPIKGDFYWGHTASATTEAAGRAVDHAWVRVELFMGTVRVGGYEDHANLFTNSGGWSWLSLNLWPEVRVLEAGSPLTLKVTRGGGVGDFYVGTGGNHQSVLDIRYYPDDPLGGAVYLENRKIASYTSKDSTLSAEEMAIEAQRFAATPWFRNQPPGLYKVPAHERDEGEGTLGIASMALLPGLFLAPWRRMRSFSVVAALAVVSVAGCVGGPPAGAGAADPDAASSSVEVKFEERESLANTSKGAIEGLVQDDLGFPIAGAHVSLLATHLFENTDRKGLFKIGNVSAGTYVMRIDAKQYSSLERELEVRPGQVTLLNVTLQPLVAKEGGKKPHVHGDWGDQTELTVFSGRFTFTLPCAPSPGSTSASTGGVNVHTRPCERAIPLDVSKPVPPGAAQVQVVLKWTAASGVPAELALRVVTGIPYSQTKWTGNIGSGGAAHRIYVARPSADPFNVAIFPNEADPGHQKFTNWQLWALLPAEDVGYPKRSPDTANFEVTVEVKAFKGVVPFEPAHRSFWGERQELRVFNHASKAASEDPYSTAYPAYYGAIGSKYYQATWIPAKEVFVPPGTKELTGYLSWTNSKGLALTDWTLLYKGADLPSGSTAYQVMPLEGSGTNRTFKLPVKPEWTDQYYQSTSYWKFAVDAPGQSVTSASGTTWSLGVVAHRDPVFNETLG